MQSQWSDPPQQGGGFQVPVMTQCVKRLIIGTGVVFLLQILAGRSSGIEQYLGINPASWKTVLVPFWQLLTYGFLHDVTSFGHILWNMLLLYFLGVSLEGLIGARRFLFFYLAAMVAGGVLQVLASLVMQSSRPVIGASGAVLGVVIALAVMRPKMTIIFIIIPMTLKTMALIIVAKDLFGVILDFQNGAGGTAHFAHLGGGLFGFVGVRLGWVWRDPLAAVGQRVETMRVEQESDQRKRVDRLLDRISKEGIQSLSNSEKRFLKRASKR